MWVRGLKLNELFTCTFIVTSHPVWVRGLKLALIAEQFLTGRSHPVWVRGLKLLLYSSLKVVRLVAPRVGAWIETLLVLARLV